MPLGEAAKLELAEAGGDAARQPACGSTWPTATRGSRARCALPTAPGARIALVAGDRDIEAGTIGVKDLATGEQVDIAADSVVAEVISRLA